MEESPCLVWGETTSQAKMAGRSGETGKAENGKRVWGEGGQTLVIHHSDEPLSGGSVTLLGVG